MKGLRYLLLCCLALNSPVFASISAHNPVHGYKGEVVYKDALPYETPDHFDVIGGIGAANLDAGNSDLGVTDSETDRLVQTNNDSWDTLAAQLGLGYAFYFGNAQRYADQVQWFPSIEPELNLYYLSSNSIEGRVWRFGNSALNDVTFDIPVHSLRLMLDAALTVASWRQLSIYAIGGVGNAWNRISYSDKDNGGANDCFEQGLRLNANTRSSFAWEAGAGLAYAFNERFAVSLEYLYADLGTISTSSRGRTGGITAPTLVSPNFNLKTQSGLIALHISV